MAWAKSQLHTDFNTWKHLWANKWVILNRIISVRKQYLKPFNCVPTNELNLILKMLPTLA